METTRRLNYPNKNYRIPNPQPRYVLRSEQQDEKNNDNKRSVVSPRLLSTCYVFFVRIRAANRSAVTEIAEQQSRSLANERYIGWKRTKKAECKRSCINMCFAYSISFRVVQMHSAPNVRDKKQDKSIASNRRWAATNKREQKTRKKRNCSHCTSDMQYFAELRVCVCVQRQAIASQRRWLRAPLCIGD